MTVAELRDLLQFYPSTAEVRVKDGHHIMRESKVVGVETIPNKEWGQPPHVVFVSGPPQRP